MRSPIRRQGMLQLQSPPRVVVLHDFDEALGATEARLFSFFLLKNVGPDLLSCRPLKVEDQIVTKNRLVRDIADRCLAGNFGGIAYRAAKEPECVEFGISYQNIQYHMDQKGPLAAVDRAADRARVAAEAVAATSAPGVTPVFVFVERGGVCFGCDSCLGHRWQARMRTGSTYWKSRPPRPARGFHRPPG